VKSPKPRTNTKLVGLVTKGEQILKKREIFNFRKTKLNSFQYANRNGNAVQELTSVILARRKTLSRKYATKKKGKLSFPFFVSSLTAMTNQVFNKN